MNGSGMLHALTYIYVHDIFLFSVHISASRPVAGLGNEPRTDK